MKGIRLDPEPGVVSECYAVVYAPRRQRGRFPDNCVERVDSAEDAIEQSDPAGKRYPARVIGPSRSSEGVMLYYLDRWLD